MAELEKHLKRIHDYSMRLGKSHPATSDSRRGADDLVGSSVEASRSWFYRRVEGVLSSYHRRRDYLASPGPEKDKIRRSALTLRNSAARLSKHLELIGESGQVVLLFDIFPKAGVEDPPRLLRELRRLEQTFSLFQERLESLKFSHSTEAAKEAVKQMVRLHASCFGCLPPRSANGPFYQIVREAVEAMLGSPPTKLYRDYLAPAIEACCAPGNGSGTSSTSADP